MMQLKRLTYFAKVAELGSFSRASAYLVVAQPNLSRQLRILEEELGVRLLDRNGRGVSLTQAGDQLLQRARVIIREVEEARNDMQTMRGAPTGSARLGMPSTVSQVFLAPLVRRFLELHPQITLQVTETYSGNIYEWLMCGRLDIAVLYNAPRSPQLLADPLLTEELYLIGPSDSRVGTEVPLSEVVKLPLILPTQPHSIRNVIQSFATNRGIEVRPTLELDSLTPIKNLVAEGFGYTILSYCAVHEEIRTRRFKVSKIVDPKITRTLSLATAGQNSRRPTVAALAPLIKDVIRELVAKSQWPCQLESAQRMVEPRAKRMKQAQI